MKSIGKLSTPAVGGLLSIDRRTAISVYVCYRDRLNVPNKKHIICKIRLTLNPNDFITNKLSVEKILSLFEPKFKTKKNTIGKRSCNFFCGFLWSTYASDSMTQII